MARLSAKGIQVLKTPGMHGDGGGFYLKVSRAGTQSWMQRIAVAGRRHDLGPGRFPDVGLARARQAAAHSRSLIVSGGDPPNWQPGIPAAGSGDNHHAKLAVRLGYAPPATQLGQGTGNALTHSTWISHRGQVDTILSNWGHGRFTDDDPITTTYA